MASGARLSGHEFSTKIGTGSELIDLAFIFENKSEISEKLMVKSLQGIIGCCDGCKVIPKLL